VEFVSTAQGRFAVHEAGPQAGRPVVLVAGLGDDHASWESVLPYLTPEYRCVTFDNRGIGQSPITPGPYSALPEAHDPRQEGLGMEAGKLLEKVSDQLSVRRAFGTPYEKDGVLIIPVAMVAGGGGGGTARPRGPAAEAAPQDAVPGDVGGGFGGLILPTGVYVVKGDQVRWVPAVDVTLAVLASLGLVRVLARSWTRRRQRS